MSIIDSILNVFLGDKGKKDVKEVTPIVNSVIKFEEELSLISNDQLRSITQEFKNEIKQLKDPFSREIEDINKIIEKSENIDDNNASYKQIKKIQNQYLDKLDDYLKFNFAEGFCCCKGNN